MEQLPRLSNREWDVVKLLMQAKSNKLIASSLDISVRTVEFHLKNIYAKFQVSSRIELILKLGNATGWLEIKKPGVSTVAGRGQIAENRDRPRSLVGWAKSIKETVSIIGKEFEMKNLLSSKHIFTGMLTALLTGCAWMATLWYLSPCQSGAGFDGSACTRVSLFHSIQAWWIPPLILTAALLAWVLLGLAIGLVGKHNSSTLNRVFASSLLGTGLSPLTILPLMLAVVHPVGKLAESVGLLGPATMSNDTTYLLAMSAMTGLWLVVGIAVGIVILFVPTKKTEQAALQPRGSEQGL